MTPLVLERANALRRYAKAVGARITDLQVTITTAEAFDVLDAIEASADYLCDASLLLDDLARARMAGNPWLVLDHWVVMGVPRAPVERLH